WAENQADAHLQEGRILAWEDFWKHARSLGKTEDEAKALYSEHQDILLTYQGQQYYVGAGHFQFIAYRKILQEVLPIPSKRPMGQVMALDTAINQRGYLRLSTTEWWVQHLGNTLEGFREHPRAEAKLNNPKRRQPKNIWKWQPLRKALFWLYHKTFDLLYRES
ncbi:MAG: hypothetical protein ACPL3P_08775, partial [Anaerolineales bacterium]